MVNITRTSNVGGRRGCATRSIGNLLMIIFIVVLFSAIQNLNDEPMFLPSTTLMQIQASTGSSGHSPLQQKQQPVKPHPYQPANVELYVYNHRIDLGYDQFPSSGCDIWFQPQRILRNNANNNNYTQQEISIHQELTALRKEFDTYHAYLQNLPTSAPDVRRRIHQDGNHKVCHALEIRINNNGNKKEDSNNEHTDLFEIFQSQQLSKTFRGGYMEPMLPPARHPKWCFSKYRRRGSNKDLTNLGFLVHDFAHICKNLTATSRTVLIDLGAALDYSYHQNNDIEPPILYLTNLYAKFGIPFDHIYAFENKRAETPQSALDQVPWNLFGSYHWINVGVDIINPKSRYNPWRLLRDHYEVNDFVAVKLDIDAPHKERALLRQLLADEQLLELVDQLYFEDHVSLTEFWNLSVTMNDSLELFHALRQKGIPAHYWV